MAELIIIPILRIASVLCTCNGNNTWYLCDLQENKDALYTAMEELKDTIDDVKRKVVEAQNNPNEPMECNKEVSGWLDRLPAVEGEVVQILLKADEEIKGRCFRGYCSINYWSRYKIGKLVTQTLVTVKDLKTKAGTFGDVAYKLPPSLVEKEAAELTVGMESMFDKLWRLLAEDEVRIMGLFGQGGVGKTTLLKQINNAFQQSTTASTSTSTTHGFDVVILVVVSKVINIKDIQKEIADRLGLLSPNEKNIRSALSKKNFVLLLDDLWERVDLQSIGIPHPPPGNNKSKVVFTTRSKTVCGHMDANIKFRVECLPWDKAWTLFQEKVGNETLNSHSDVPELAKDVARKCGGLPLTLISIGRAMSCNKTVQEWNHAKTTLQKYASEFPGMDDKVFPHLKLSYSEFPDMDDEKVFPHLKLSYSEFPDMNDKVFPHLKLSYSEFPDMNDKVFPHLKLSYDHLPNDTIKSYFLYCALFPEDHSIDKAKLIDHWIGEGLISFSDFNHIDEARSKGYKVIGTLEGACLLESDQETEVKMQNTIRDMAFWIAHECGSKWDKTCIIKNSDFAADGRSSWYNAVRIYFFPPPHNGGTPPPPPPPPPPPLESPNLLAPLMEYSFIQGTLPQNFIQFTPLLRVLDLSYTKMETFPISITELLELRYLCLSNTLIQELPQELGKLVKLNFLYLSHMHHLQKIPIGVIGSLLKLRVLNLFGCSGAEYLDIEEVYKLKHLNDFGITIKIENNTLTKLLSSSNQNLQMCTRHLLLSNQYFFDGSKDKPQSTIIPLEKLQFLSKLETLRLEQFHEPELMNMGIEQQQHLGSRFQNLSQVYLWCCRALKDLTWVAYVPNLKTLDVDGCEELEEIVIVVVDDFGGSTGEGDEIATRMMNTVQDEVFKRLKTLILRDQPKLKSICKSALAFPCLETMEIYRCPQLTKLPFDSGSNINTTLRKIEGGPKWWSELQWEEEEDHNNNELLKYKFLPYFVECSDHDAPSLVIVQEDESLVIVQEEESFVQDESFVIVEEDEILVIVEENKSLDIVQIMMLCVYVCIVCVCCLLVVNL